MFAKSLYALAFLGGISARRTPPSSYPHAWPGQPTGDYSPAWQNYFQVKNLPGEIPSGLPRSFAGNIPVDRAGHPNNTLFFWGFERQGANGSLTASAEERSTEPWILWLQGGPGASGMLGLAGENGPIQILNNGSWTTNPYSWNTLADVIWMDQPVGTGFSTTDSKGYVKDEDQMAEDFLGFLKNLVKVFPSLATRPLYLMGESYAGTYIPYIAKHLFAQSSSPVALRKIAIGDGALAPLATVRDLPVINVLETYPSIIGYDQDVYNYFKEQHHLCGFDLKLTYPQHGTFPALNLQSGARKSSSSSASSLNARDALSWRDAIAEEYDARQRASPTNEHPRQRLQKRAEWKRGLAGRANGTIDPWYGCDLFDEMRDYALNFTFPWTNGGFHAFNVPDATNPKARPNAAPFFNKARTRRALHAPTSKDWALTADYPFGSSYTAGDPSAKPVEFLSALFASAAARGVSMVFYSGNDDAQVQHRGTEVVIQNTTWGGVQGFARKPATRWLDDQGNAAGVVHQERGLTYVLFEGAGHLVPQGKPAQALVFLREFVLGDNKLGALEGEEVVGGEDAALASEDYLPGGTEIVYGSGTPAGTSMVPAATVAAWESFLATATAATARATTSSSSSSVSLRIKSTTASGGSASSSTATATTNATAV